MHFLGYLFAGGIQLWHQLTEELKKDKEKLRNSTRFINDLMRKSQATKFIFENYQEGLLRDSLGSFKVDGRVKDLLCMIRLYQSTSKPTRHFLVLRARDVDAGIVKVILLFYWFSLCCRSRAIGQSLEVVIHRTRRRQTGREDRVVHLENSLLSVGWSEADVFMVHLETVGGD